MKTSPAVSVDTARYLVVPEKLPQQPVSVLT